MSSLIIRELQKTDFTELVKFCDKEIGDHYYSEKDLISIFRRSHRNNLMASYVAINGIQQIVAMRLTYAPGQWIDKETRGLTTHDWMVDKHRVAYFKSLFISSENQKQGLGPQLSQLSIETIKKQGAKAVICHSWLQSPGNTSQKYLSKMGFIPIKEHPLFWHPIDYRCTVCGDKRCECTALEMILYL